LEFGTGVLFLRTYIVAIIVKMTVTVITAPGIAVAAPGTLHEGVVKFRIGLIF